jgi:hypothetical protein
MRRSSPQSGTGATCPPCRCSSPARRGFERFYGFLGAETNQWYPDLVYDNHPVDQPKSPAEGYHLTDDLTDKALEFIKDATGGLLSPGMLAEAVTPQVRRPGPGVGHGNAWGLGFGLNDDGYGMGGLGGNYGVPAPPAVTRSGS